MSHPLPSAVSQFLGAHAERLYSAEQRLRGAAAAARPDDDDWPNDIMVVCLTKLVVAAQSQQERADWVPWLPNLALVCCVHTASPPDVAQLLRTQLLATQPTGARACIHEAVPALRRACRHAVHPSPSLGTVSSATPAPPRGSVNTAALVDLLRHMAASPAHHRLARCCTAWVAAHLGTAHTAPPPNAAAAASIAAQVAAASAEAVQLLCQLANAGCVSPEALHKLAFLAAVETRLPGLGSDGGNLPPLMGTYLQAVAGSGVRTLAPELVRSAVAPLLRSDSSLAAVMQAALAPCMAPAGSSSMEEDATLLPGHMYLPLGAAANAVCSLVAPSAAMHASHPPSDAAWDAVAARLAAYARQHGGETPQVGLLCVGLVAAMATSTAADQADGDVSFPSPEGRSRAHDLLARIMAEQHGNTASMDSHEGEDRDLRAPAWWNAFASALCDAALRHTSGVVAPGTDDTAALPPTPDHSDHSGCAVASASWLAHTWPPCAALLTQLVSSHAAAYARSGSGSHLTQCNALLALLRVAGKSLPGGGSEALHPAAALFLADACAALEPAVRAGVAWCAPGMPPPLGASVTSFCGAVREASRRHLWWAFLPLCCIPFRKSPEEVIQGWEASVSAGALHAEATTAAAAAAAACSLSGAAATWEYLALHAITNSPDAEAGTPAQVDCSPGEALLGSRSDAAATSMLLTWLLLRLHARVVSDAAVLTPPPPGVAARMRALVVHAHQTAAAAHGPSQRALSAACFALTGALEAVDADAAQVRSAAEAAAAMGERDEPSRKWRRLYHHGSGVEAPPGQEDGDTYALQMAPLVTAVQEVVLPHVMGSTGDDPTAALVQTLTSAWVPQSQRARALHVAARVLCCAAPHGQGEAVTMWAASLRRHLLAAASANTPGAATPEAGAAIALCRRTRVLL